MPSRRPAATRPARADLADDGALVGPMSETRDRMQRLSKSRYQAIRPITEVVFVAVAAGIGECELLAEAIGASPDLNRDTRFPYHPHVTVAHDVAPEALDRVYADLAGFSATFRVESFTLFLHTPDARWQPHRDYPLGG